MILTFDRFALNTEAYELRCDGKVRPAEPLVFDLIAYFAAHPDQILSRDRMVEAIWKGRSVADATIATCIKSARKALDDTGRNQTLIRTVRGRGFRFTAEVTSTDLTDQESSLRATAAADRARLAGRDLDPALLLLPFRCSTDDRDRETRRFAVGLSSGLGTILTRVPLLRLFAQGDGEADPMREPQAAARQPYPPGLDFVVDGSVQDIGGQWRTSVVLGDARSNIRIWAEAFDQTASPASAVDDCVAAVIGKLEPQIYRAMYRLVRSRDGEPTARQLLLEAHGLLAEQGWNVDSFAEAKPLLRRSAELDPGLALAPALLSLLTGIGARVGVEGDRERAHRETLDAAERALRLDSMDSTVLGYAGCALADIGQVDRGETLLRNAIDLNPANAQALVSLGTVLVGRKELSEAVDLLARGIRISPLDPRLSVWGAIYAATLLRIGDVERAIEVAQTACRRSDRTYLPRVALAAARLVQGDAAAAIAALEEARRTLPGLGAPQLRSLVGRQLSERLLAL
jgi:DNA-binding winged helix-turn-helix (wHTH) protein/tetratricopeptide (TPR) repeat protein